MEGEHKYERTAKHDEVAWSKVQSKLPLETISKHPKSDQTSPKQLRWFFANGIGWRGFTVSLIADSIFGRTKRQPCRPNEPLGSQGRRGEGANLRTRSSQTQQLNQTSNTLHVARNHIISQPVRIQTATNNLVNTVENAPTAIFSRKIRWSVTRYIWVSCFEHPSKGLNANRWA